jgi:hypothetical protein
MSPQPLLTTELDCSQSLSPGRCTAQVPFLDGTLYLLLIHRDGDRIVYTLCETSCTGTVTRGGRT